MAGTTAVGAKLKSRIGSFFSFLPKAETVVKAMLRATSRVPFVDDVLAMYYCGIDPKTPKRVKLAVAGTLLYLVMPLDLIPDFLAVIGFTDDITALAIVVRLVSSHIDDGHRTKAKDKIGEIRGETVPQGTAA
jgi:uncharacterized membrane protein YkvA (DUF1232 family)